MVEGGLKAPVRHPLDWHNPDFFDGDSLDAELRRVFDICHGCRRCFNLCDSFPRLFDLIDDSDTGELDSVASADFEPVIDACTLCDMCFMTKCPYVPPHEFNLDFPHLMLRARAIDFARGKVGFAARQMTETDRNGRLARLAAPLFNWATRRGNWLTRPILELVAGIHRDVELPRFHGKTLVARARLEAAEIDCGAPAQGRKAVIYATCFANYNNPDTGMAARAVLAKNGVAAEIAYPGCCGMPQLEHGDLGRVAGQARQVAAHFKDQIAQGYDVIALVPSCALMLKFEWPLLLPDDEDIKRLGAATRDICEYVVDIAANEGLAAGLNAVEGGVSLHIACHARAQNMGHKAAEMLRLIPGMDPDVLERCSGHGGSVGITKDYFETAVKLCQPVAKRATEQANAYVCSECPLAGKHVVQCMERMNGDASGTVAHAPGHPIEILAQAYGIDLEGAR